jgi:hypothetical protein
LERLLVSTGPVVFVNVGFLGDDIDKVLARDLEVKPKEGVDVFERLEPSEVYDCAREREAIGTVKLSDDPTNLLVTFSISFGGSVSGPGIGRSWKAA